MGPVVLYRLLPVHRCLQIDVNNYYLFFAGPKRLQLCHAFLAEPDVCGDSREQAPVLINALENLTQPVNNSWQGNG
ncbi:MAG: hypothetical protein ACI9WS_001639 [Paraglaciecola psychrophila]